MEIELIEAERDEDMPTPKTIKLHRRTNAELVEKIVSLQAQLAQVQARAAESYETGRQWKDEADKRAKIIAGLETQEANNQRRLDHAWQEIAELKGWQARVREVERGFKDEPSEVTQNDPLHPSTWMRHP